MLHEITVDVNSYLDGITSPKLGTAKVVVKDGVRDNLMANQEEAAFLVGTILGVPVAPGFRDGLRWNSVFVQDMQTGVQTRVGADPDGNRYSQPASKAYNEAMDNVPVDLRAMCAVFDTVIGNGDRHDSNMGFCSDGGLVLFDHHLTFRGSDHGEIYSDEYYRLRKSVHGAELAAAIRKAQELLTESLLNSVLSKLDQVNRHRTYRRVRTLEII